jgi:hypothetical protein
LAVVVGMAGGLVWAAGEVVRKVLRGRKLTTPLGTIEDTSAHPETPHDPPGCDDPVSLDQVDEAAFANPTPIMASVLDRQLEEVYGAIKESTQAISGGIQDSDRETHMFKRSQVQIVFEAQVRSITKRLIYNGLHRLKDSDIRAYCDDRAEKVLTAVAADLEDRLLSLGLPRLDIVQALHDQRRAVLDILAEMYRACVKIAKEAHCAPGGTL